MSPSIDSSHSRINKFIQLIVELFFMSCHIAQKAFSYKEKGFTSFVRKSQVLLNSVDVLTEMNFDCHIVTRADMSCNQY